MIENERRKYTKIYQQHPSYGDATHGRAWINYIKMLQPTKVLDVGCGSNLFLAELGIEGVGVDLACGKADVNAPMHDLPFEDKSFDVTTCWDVLEHIPPALLNASLQEIVRVTRYRVIGTIAHAADDRFDESLHLIIEGPRWWRDVLSTYGSYRCMHYREKPTGRTTFELLLGE